MHGSLLLCGLGASKAKYVAQSATTHVCTRYLWTRGISHLQTAVRSSSYFLLRSSTRSVPVVTQETAEQPKQGLSSTGWQWQIQQLVLEMSTSSSTSPAVPVSQKSQKFEKSRFYYLYVPIVVQLNSNT